MQFDLRGSDAARAYSLLASVIVPRPIALVTSVGGDGRVNAAPFSFFNLVGSSPPVVALGIGHRGPATPKDTRANIERAGEFVVNLVDEELAAAMNVCGIDFPPGVDELKAAGLTPAPAAKVRAPLIAEAPAQMECVLHSVVAVGDNQIVLAEVVFLHVRGGLVDAERRRVRTEALGLIGRMHGGGWYARTTDLFEMPRLSHDEWVENGGASGAA